MVTGANTRFDLLQMRKPPATSIAVYQHLGPQLSLRNLLAADLQVDQSTDKVRQEFWFEIACGPRDLNTCVTRDQLMNSGLKSRQ